jgi:hypothetical protein
VPTKSHDRGLLAQDLGSPGIQTIGNRAYIRVRGGQHMLSAARCAWLGFVEASRFEAALIPLGAFLVLILFFLFQDRMRRVLRRIFQIAVTIFVIAGLGAITYETLSPKECTASSEELNSRERSGD